MFRFAIIILLLLSSLVQAETVPGRIIVKFKPGAVGLPKGLSVASVRTASVAASSVRALNAKHGVTELIQLYRDVLAIRPDWKQYDDTYLLILPKDRNVAKAAGDFQQDPNVIRAFPDTVVTAFDITPNDPKYSEQWGLVKIEAPRGWVKTTGTAEAIIAILDTGMNYNHEDFAGKVDLTHAKNYVADPSNGSGDALDDYGHGTAVAGVIGAIGNNGKGIAGLDWKAKLLPIKVLGSDGKGEMAAVSSGLAYLAALKSTGVNIVSVNMSLGQTNSGANKYIEESVGDLKSNCQAAFNSGMVLVAAAGNDGVDYNTYPAFYSTVIAVAATDTADLRSIWSGGASSNYGTWVDVSAPGTSIYSTLRDGNSSYGNGWNGTSLACPLVAALAALMKTADSTLTNEAIVDQIKRSADNIDALNPTYVGRLGSGRINAYRALAGILVEITSPATGEFISGSKAILGTAAGWNFKSFALDVIKSGSVEANLATGATSIESGLLATWNTAAFYGPYTLRLRVIATDNTSLDASATVTVDNVSPDAAILSPLNAAGVDGKAIILGTAKDAYFDRYSLDYGEGSSPASFQNIGTFYASVESGTLGSWETAGLSGVYTLKLSVYDKVGSLSTSRINLNLAGSQLPSKSVQAQSGLPPTFVLPNPFDRATASSTAFTYTLLGNFDATIYLFDLNGNLIWQKTYPAGENGGKAGANSPAWDGQSLFGEKVNSGVYLYQVTADKKVIAKGKIVVLN